MRSEAHLSYSWPTVWADLVRVGVPTRGVSSADTGGGASRVTIHMTPASAVRAAAVPTASGAGPIPDGYVQLDDRSVLERMLRNIADNAALLAAVKAHHTLDAGGPLLSAFTRLVGMEEAEAIEVRHIRNLLGGI